MTLEQEFFIQILSDHIRKEKTNPRFDIDWKSVAKLARSHQVEGIVFFQCRDFMSEDVKSSFRQAYGTYFFSFANRKALYKEVITVLNQENISFISVKGFSIADYYPVPSLRTMGDCDLIVHRQDMPATMSIMRGLGFSGIDNKKAHDWECVRNDFLFELHDSLVESADHINALQEQFFNQYDFFVNDGQLNWNFHFLYLLMHLRKHFMNSGVGIRQFMDIAVLLAYGPGFDWRWIKEKLEELELSKFAKVCFSLIETWFGVKSPFDCFDLDPSFSDTVTEKLLSNGVFGDNNKENQGNYERNVLNRRKGSLWLNRLLMLLRFAFPSYSYMRSYPGCGYVDGRVYLLPVSWIHRFILYLKQKNRTTVSGKIKAALSPEAKLNDQREFLEKMGL